MSPSNIMSMEELHIASVADNELFAYIGPASASKEWPRQIVHLGITWNYDECWVLPTQMGSGFIQAARYLVFKR